MTTKPSQQELDDSIDALTKYRDRLRKELITNGQKLRMPEKKINSIIQEHSELQKVELTLKKLLAKNNSEKE